MGLIHCQEKKAEILHAVSEDFHDFCKKLNFSDAWRGSEYNLKSLNQSGIWESV